MKSYALLLAAAALALPLHSAAQAQDPRMTANPTLPVPDRLELHRLIWSTMVAIDQANKSGNYSVLRDVGATGFQVRFSAAQLGSIFESLREQQIDLSNTLLLAPEFSTDPVMVSADVVRLQGVFGLRPLAIQFDLFYQWQAGEWRLYGVDIQPRQIATEQPEGTG